MKLSVLFASLATTVLAGGAARIALTSQALQRTISASDLVKHATRLQEISALSGGTRHFGSKAYNASISYVKSEPDKTGFYGTQYQTISHPVKTSRSTFPTPPASPIKLILSPFRRRHLETLSPL